ncbi:MAG: hypothetical protein ABN482_14120 [Corticimicrobacter sp.]|uniref:YncE family protein n=1 Tax=Corticimicrobacter sp. TaxID=2678536 RepID=UPI0032DACCBC
MRVAWSVLWLCSVMWLGGCAAQMAGHGQEMAGSGTVTQRVLAQGLYELVYSERQDAVFVVSAGDRHAPDAVSRVLRLDPVTLAVQSTITLPLRGFGLALDDASGRLYVGHSLDAAVSVVDIDQGGVRATIRLAEPVRTADGMGRLPHHFREMVVDTVTGRLFMPGLWFDDSALYVVDLGTQAVERVLPGLGFVATGIALDIDGRSVFVSNLQGQLFEFDADTLALRQQRELDVDQPLNLVFDHKARRLFMVDQGLAFIEEMRKTWVPAYMTKGAGNRVVAVDVQTGHFLLEMPARSGPVGMLLAAAQQRLYVALRESGSVAEYDIDTGRVLRVLTLGGQPNSLAFNPDGHVLYVTVKQDEAQEATAGSEGEIRDRVARIAF